MRRYNMLKLENVSKYYYSSSSVTCALRKINLKLNIGEFIAITGESGSGKTTLLNILSIRRRAARTIVFGTEALIWYMLMWSPL